MGIFLDALVACCLVSKRTRLQKRSHRFSHKVALASGQAGDALVHLDLPVPLSDSAEAYVKATESNVSMPGNPAQVHPRTGDGAGGHQSAENASLQGPPSNRRPRSSSGRRPQRVKWTLDSLLLRAGVSNEADRLAQVRWLHGAGFLPHVAVCDTDAATGEAAKQPLEPAVIIALQDVDAHDAKKMGLHATQVSSCHAACRAGPLNRFTCPLRFGPACMTTIQTRAHMCRILCIDV